LAITEHIAGTDKQVEERPSITYADVGGCKEQIEKLREVVELPLLEVRLSFPVHGQS
jgi:ATP-dependent 26S proteasome regulatory subunit